jgi:hypothetical protein
MGADAAVSQARLTARLATHRLAVLGAFAPTAEDGLPAGTRSLALIGPEEPGFWPAFTQSPEWQDGAPDPMDRWSHRVLTSVAADFGATALFPFGGPPYHPFYQWALRSGRAWASPIRLLVHDTAGLMISYRGALALPFDLPQAPATCPCDTCDRPCLTTCPVNALSPAGYDLPACHGWLDSAAGQSCMSRGCAARRACPAAQGYARMPEQSAYHMRQFHK